MKIKNSILWIVLGIIIFALGCAIDNNSAAFIVEFIGAILLMVGLYPFIERSSSNTNKREVNN